MYKIINRVELNSTVTKLDIYAPLIAKKCEPGQFVILRVNEDGERIPLTIADYDRVEGTVTIIFQVVGKTTMLLNEMKVGDSILDFVGPLGNETKLDGFRNICVIGGGVGSAIAYPIAKKAHELGINVTSICGYRNKDLVILEDDFRNASDTFILKTDDGSYGTKGLVTDALDEFGKEGKAFDCVIAIGPIIMMKFVTLTAKKYDYPTIVSMNPIMIDGTGMCGGCRLTVDGKTKFACVDGPDFNGYLVDFDEAMSRSRMYNDFEKKSREDTCNLLRKGDENHA